MKINSTDDNKRAFLELLKERRLPSNHISNLAFCEDCGSSFVYIAWNWMKEERTTCGYCQGMRNYNDQ